MKQPINILISGGGTGGHIFPAIAIANQLKLQYPKTNFLFVGAKGKMEMEKVPQAGYTIKGLWISGIQRRLTIKNFLFPFQLVHSLLKARRIIKKFMPDVVIGTGGFASGPILLMANRRKIPTLIQEQNSYPGITNQVLSKKSTVVCVAYDRMDRFFSSDKIVKTGNPVRSNVLSIYTKKKVDEARASFELDEKTKTILVLGGSLGARKINELVEQNLLFFKEHKVQILWQCGKLYHNDYLKYNKEENISVHAFIKKMDLAYAAADLIISRAGASSVSELCIVAKPTIFIPSPNVVKDHQTKNARAIVEKQAAIMLSELELSRFPSVFETLLKDQKKQEHLRENIKKLAFPNATKRIVNQIESLLDL